MKEKLYVFSFFEIVKWWFTKILLASVIYYNYTLKFRITCLSPAMMGLRYMIDSVNCPITFSQYVRILRHVATFDPPNTIFSVVKCYNQLFVTYIMWYGCSHSSLGCVSCSLLNIYWHFRGVQFLHLQRWAPCEERGASSKIKQIGAVVSCQVQKWNRL